MNYLRLLIFVLALIVQQQSYISIMIRIDSFTKMIILLSARWSLDTRNPKRPGCSLQFSGAFASLQAWSSSSRDKISIPIELKVVGMENINAYLLIVSLGVMLIGRGLFPLQLPGFQTHSLMLYQTCSSGCCGTGYDQWILCLWIHS